MALLSTLLSWLTRSLSGPQPPTVDWLLSNRHRLHGKRARTKGNTPLASLYRMYEYLVIGYYTGLRSEIEHFYNQPAWHVSAIPDPKDTDPQRYAILAALPSYLVAAFNRLAQRGLPRGSPAIIISDQEERRLRGQNVQMEAEPEWSKGVPKLEETLVLHTDTGKEPNRSSCSQRLLAMNVLVEEPNVMFV